MHHTCKNGGTTHVLFYSLWFIWPILHWVAEIIHSIKRALKLIRFQDGFMRAPWVSIIFPRMTSWLAFLCCDIKHYKDFSMKLSFRNQPLTNLILSISGKGDFSLYHKLGLSLLLSLFGHLSLSSLREIPASLYFLQLPHVLCSSVFVDLVDFFLYFWNLMKYSSSYLVISTLPMEPHNPGPQYVITEVSPSFSLVLWRSSHLFSVTRWYRLPEDIVGHFSALTIFSIYDSKFFVSSSHILPDVCLFSHPSEAKGSLTGSLAPQNPLMLH